MTDTYSTHTQQTLDLRLAISQLCAGKPAGVAAVACVEYMLHLAQQPNGNRAFREALIAMFEDGARVIREHL